MIAVNHTGGVYLACHERACSFSFTSDMIAMLPPEEIIVHDLEILTRNQTLCSKMRKREECGLRRVNSSDSHLFVAQVGHCLDARIMANNNDGCQVLIRVPHGERPDFQSK